MSSALTLDRRGNSNDTRCNRLLHKPGHGLDRFLRPLWWLRESISINVHPPPPQKKKRHTERVRRTTSTLKIPQPLASGKLTSANSRPGERSGKFDPRGHELLKMMASGCVNLDESRLRRNFSLECRGPPREDLAVWIERHLDGC